MPGPSSHPRPNPNTILNPLQILPGWSNLSFCVPLSVVVPLVLHILHVSAPSNPNPNGLSAPLTCYSLWRHSINVYALSEDSVDSEAHSWEEKTVSPACSTSPLLTRIPKHLTFGDPICFSKSVGSGRRHCRYWMAEPQATYCLFCGTVTKASKEGTSVGETE